MGNQLVKTETTLTERSTVSNSTRHLLISIHKKNKLEINNNLEKYREGGIVKYENLLSVPLKDRIVGLVNQYGKEKIHGLMVVLVTDFCNYYNVIRPMTADQIVDCAFELINTSIEDYLSIEDFTVFFQGAKNGKYGKIYDRLDRQTIFDMLEIYRQERHKIYVHIQEEKEVQYKCAGSQLRTSEDTKELKDLFHEANLQYFKEKNNIYDVSDMPTT